ncbi:hypothetical protein EPN15_02520, partial [Patescibacteria group bacterium]
MDHITLKNTYISAIFLTGIVIAFVFPLAAFCFSNLYFDRSEDDLRYLKQEKQKIYPEYVEKIKQPIFYTSKNFARVTIKAKVAKKNIQLDLLDDRGNVLRTGGNPKIEAEKIIWKFDPVKDSANKKYNLVVNIPNNNKKNIRLPLVSTAGKDYSVEINGELKEKMSIAFYTESKFANPKEKMRIFY